MSRAGHRPSPSTRGAPGKRCGARVVVACLAAGLACAGCGDAGRSSADAGDDAGGMDATADGARDAGDGDDAGADASSDGGAPRDGGSDGGPGDGGADAAPADAGTDAGSVDAGPCGELGTACTDESGCTRDDLECQANTCVPAGRDTCAGFAGAPCDDPDTPECIILSGDFGWCFTEAEVPCVE